MRLLGLLWQRVAVGVKSGAGGPKIAGLVVLTLGSLVSELLNEKCLHVLRL